jgi:aminopeptidase N
MKRLVLPAAVILLATAFPSRAQRLPDTVVPDSYDLKFAPDLPEATFTGEETIHVHIQKPTTSVTLNSAEIEIMEASIASGDFRQAAFFKTDDKTETATITVPSTVPAGSAEIHIRFSGILNDKLRGFYLSQTPRRRYAVTQFEATDARRAFPCFDEPAYKAVFRISLVVDKNDTAISNGSIVSDTPGPQAGKHTLQFSDTPRMSSYLVAMMVGDFACVEGSADQIPIRVCAVPEKRQLLDYALLSAENNLKFYDTYFSVKYPYHKLDIVAFPDFSAGAMENLAAITYRETLLTIDDRTASVGAHEAVVSVLAHEMAHMWFGDLVTMQWWNDIWLNEGFATWMSAKPAESWKPEWHGERAEIQETLTALSADAITSIRPIRANAETPAEIETLFDGIAYGKAASVLRMVEAYVGTETFRKGANAYLEKHAYANATAEDFWNQMTATSGKPVDQILAGFIQQPGAPLISVKTSCSQKKLGKFKKAWTTQVALSQQRYFSDAAKLDSGSPELWQVPVNLRPAGAKDSTYVLLQGRQQTFDLPGCAAWVFANGGGRGYYRSEYEPAGLGKISSEMETSLTPEERMRFVGDVWSMVYVGHLKVGDYLDILQKMKSERTREVVEEITSRFASLHDYVVAAADRPALEKWIRDFLRPIANELGETPVSGEPDEKRALRSDVFAALGTYGRDPQLLAESRTLVEQYMRDPGSVDASLAKSALNISALTGDAALYDKYVQQMRAAKTPEEYYNYFAALGRFPDPALTERTFALALSPEVRNQDLFFLGNTFANPDTQAAAWELLKTNYDALVAKAGTELGGGLVDFAGVFCDERLGDDAQDFFASKNIPGAERQLKNAKDDVSNCVQLRRLQQSNLSAYLNGGPSKSAAPR